MLRRQVEALEETLGFTSTKGAAPADAAAVLLLADAIRRRRRLQTAYRTFAGEESERELSPHGLVVHSGRWYLAAFDHLRDDMRTFRVDRMWRTALADAPAEPPPDGFDAVAHVTRSLARVPWKWEVEVLLDLPVDEAARRIPATLAELVDDPDGTLLRMRVGLARLDGDRPRRSRLRLHDPPAGRAAGERARPRGAARRADAG